MDDLFQGLMSTGRGPLKMQRTAEEPSNLGIPAFDAVFEDHVDGAGTSMPDVLPTNTAPAASGTTEGNDPLAEQLSDLPNGLTPNATLVETPTPGFIATSQVRANTSSEPGVRTIEAAANPELTASPSMPRSLPYEQVLNHSPGQPISAVPSQNQKLPEALSVVARHFLPDRNDQPKGFVESVEQTFPFAGVGSGVSGQATTSIGAAMTGPQTGLSIDPIDVGRSATPINAPYGYLTEHAIKGPLTSPTGAQISAQATIIEASGARQLLPQGAEETTKNLVNPDLLLGGEARPIGIVSNSGETKSSTEIGQRPAMPAAANSGSPNIPTIAGEVVETALPDPDATELADGLKRELRGDFEHLPPRNHGSVATPAPGSAVTFEVAASTTSLAPTNTGTNLATAGGEVAIGVEPYAALQGSAHGSATPLSGASPMPAGLPPNAPNLAAQQIAAALQENGTDPGHPIEIALDPPELGRVRLYMVELAGVLTLTIHAERPETAELMRRHLDLLAQEFLEAGVDAPSVRVSQDGADGQTDRENTTEQGISAADDGSDGTDSIAMQPQTPDRAGALDLRL
jgi:hypothetical protein